MKKHIELKEKAMLNISRRNLIIAGIIVAVIVAICGYSIVNKRSSSQVTFQGGSIIKDYARDGAEGKKEVNGSETTHEAANAKSKEIVVHIIGRVKKQGLVKIPEGGRISDAIEVAGGVLPDADLEVINLAYKLQDGKQVYIPSKNEQANGNSEYNKNNLSASVRTKSGAAALQRRKLVAGVQTDTEPPKKIASDSAGVVEEKGSQAEKGDKNADMVNINSADAKELDKLPGVGPSTAQKIIEYRNNSGIFKTPEDIMKVKGIGKGKYEKIKANITV